jgi:glyoxylase-like metal-dependent hydrolase (beta-lactamase superfamily II)/8-oxo-dGTP pyrophosphatase MutT (NUDIX family)
MNEPAFDVFADTRRAASVIVLRDRADVDQGAGIEVLMMRRAERDGDFRSGAAVFPGGVLDARDRDAHRHCVGWDDAAASARLGLADGGLDYFVAAVRESFEEVGLLFAEPVDLADRAALERAHQDWRDPMQRGEQPIARLCETLGLRIDLRGWHYFSHWLTPPGLPKRFDTRFFVARAPAGQTATPDLGEAVELMWLTPAEALDAQRGLTLLPVTRRTLQILGRFAAVQEALESARSQADVPLTMPRRAASAKGLRIVLPDEYPFAEIGRLDPTGRADAHADIVAGRVVRLSDRVLRVTAPNPGVMTGPGTNSYLVGDPVRNRWTVIDPGPANASHLQALLAAAPGPIEQILVTHTHLDHSPGAAALAGATGTPVLGMRPVHAAGQDGTFAPTRELAHGEVLVLGPDATLRAMHTPGHASNHLCYLLQEEKTLFTGDHVMQGSTVVINPPDGDMAAYLGALRGLLEIDLDWLAAGHGFLVARPHDVLRALIVHRLAREVKVADALRARRRATLDELLPAVYADVPRAIYPVARRSLLAHLLKLQADARADCDGEVWLAVE